MEKRSIIFSFYAMLLLLLCTGCVSRRAVDDTIINYQRKIDRLESTIQQYDTAIGTATEELGRLKDRSQGMEGDIDYIIKLFDDYQQGVTRLIQNYYKIRDEAKAVLEDTSWYDNSTYNNDSLQGNCFYSLCKRTSTSTVA